MSGEDEFEAALWTALRVHRVAVDHANVFVADLLRLARAYSAGDSDTVTEARRAVLERERPDLGGIHNPVETAAAKR